VLRGASAMNGALTSTSSCAHVGRGYGQQQRSPLARLPASLNPSQLKSLKGADLRYLYGSRKR
jgi:hypothetical protein